MTSAPVSSNRKFLSRERMTRFFLWISVLAWGFLLGAKLFDLMVLVGAWSASPPGSLSLLPYGPQYPVDTGDFFIPSSAALLLSALGALIYGWKTRAQYRTLLLLSFAMIFATLVFTVIAFWPRNAALWAVARDAPNALKDKEAILLMVRQWVVFDWMRIAMGLVGWVAAIRAISVPFPPLIDGGRASPAMKVGYGLCIGIVLLFVVFFLLGVL